LEVHRDLLPVPLLDRERNRCRGRKLDGLGRHNRDLIGGEQNISWFDTGVESRPIDLDILKHPLMSGREQCRPSRSMEGYSGRILTKEMNRLYGKLIKEILHLENKLLRVFCIENALAAGLDQTTPIVPIEGWIE